ncbi:MAG: xanthine dehydrogenase accessory protein XdhC [Pseudomonadota bacterium]
MVGFDLDALSAAVAREEAVARVLVAHVEGSAPRAPGAAILVWATGQSGSIGGGALEWEAAARARDLLAGAPWARADLRMALGPGLGQCCGGAVRLVIERFAAGELAMLGALRQGGAPHFARPLAHGAVPEGGGLNSARAPFGAQALARAARSGAAGDAPVAIEAGWLAEPWATADRTLYLYGAGHVGRAIVHALAGLPWRIVWIDDAAARFPDALPAHAEQLVAANPADAVALAGPEAAHLVLTYSHALDLEICHRILGRPFGFAGLIGSASKAARFRSRLRALGHGPAALARLTCPIGDKRLGKAPAAIAIGVAAELLRLPAAERMVGVA